MSGVTVYSESISIIKIILIPGLEAPVYISSLIFTDNIIADLGDTAGSAPGDVTLG